MPQDDHTRPPIRWTRMRLAVGTAALVVVSRLAACGGETGTTQTTVTNTTVRVSTVTMSTTATYTLTTTVTGAPPP